jgi:hypothetical protein
MTNKITDERLREIVEGTYCAFDEGGLLATELFAARKEIETLKSELDLAHKMHDVAVKERNYERFSVKCLMEELNRKS